MFALARIVVVILFELFLLINAQDPIELQSGVHLFVDDQYIQNLTSLQFENGIVEKDTLNPIVYPEYPWESAVHFYTSFVQVPSNLSLTDKSTYMIYYACAPSYAILFNHTVDVCVGTSTDGIKWNKPLFSYYPYTANGTQPAQPTNIVFRTSINEFLGSVFIDTKQGVPRSEIFKMTYENEGGRYVYIAKSADGFNWTAGTERANPVGGLSDTQTSMFYSNENGGQYVLYGRHDAGVPNSTVLCPGANAVFRHVMVTVSSNSTHGPWTTPIETFKLGEPDPIQCFDSYNPAALYYHNVYLLFPSGMLHWPLSDSGAPIVRAGANDGVMDIRLSVSRNALGPYRFVSRDSFISRGIGTIDPISKLVNGSGSDRDAGFVFASSNGLLDPDFVKTPVNEENPSSWMYHLYWGSQTTHAGGGAFLARYWPYAYSGIFKAKIRREGYVALSTLSTDPAGFGSFRTQILSLPKSIPNKQLQLKLNAQISTAGFLNVQFEDGESGIPFRGFTFEQCKTLHGNNVRQLVQFIKEDNTTFSDLTPLANYPKGIRIHIQMGHTKLYSWLFSYN